MVAVVGCGYWGKNLIRNFASLGALSAVCDENETLATQLGEQHGVQARSFENILLDPTIQAIAIAAAPEHNHPLTVKALKAQKHVFVEKPYAYTLEGAEAIEETLQECHLKGHSPVFMVGHLLLYHRAFHRLQELLAQGHIGQLKEIRSIRHGLGRIRKNFGVLWELGPHDLSLMLALNPYEVTEVHSVSSRSLTSNEDSLRAHYTFANGVSASLSCSWVEPFKQQQLILQGTRGFLIFDDTRPWHEKIHLVTFPKTMDCTEINTNQFRVEALAVEPHEALAEECRHFIKCIQGQAKPLSGITQARKVFDILWRTQQAL